MRFFYCQSGWKKSILTKDTEFFSIVEYFFLIIRLSNYISKCFFSKNEGFLCDEMHTARALGFRQRLGINTAEFYWLTFYKASAIDARNFCLRLGADLVHIRDESDNFFLKCKKNYLN